MIDAEWSKKCSVILLNEILPRAKKLKLSLEEFRGSIDMGALARLEYEGIITRKELREILDERVKELQQNDNIQND